MCVDLSLTWRSVPYLAILDLPPCHRSNDCFFPKALPYLPAPPLALKATSSPIPCRITSVPTVDHLGSFCPPIDFPQFHSLFGPLWDEGRQRNLTFHRSRQSWNYGGGVAFPTQTRNYFFGFPIYGPSRPPLLLSPL